MLGVVKAGDILEVVWVSLVAGVFVSVAFLVRGARHGALDGGRPPRHGSAAVAYAGLAVVAFAAFAAAVVLGVQIMLSKD